MPAKLSTLLERVKNFKDIENADLIFKFYEFMKSNSSSESHIINNLKAIINFENFFQSEKSLKEVKILFLYIFNKYKNMTFLYLIFNK